MNPPSRYHIALTTNWRSKNTQSFQSQGENRITDDASQRRKKNYELQKRERLIAGPNQKGQNADHKNRLYTVEQLFELQSEQLTKLATRDNKAIGLAKEQGTTTHTQMREEILQPTEDILRALRNQFYQA